MRHRLGNPHRRIHETGIAWKRSVKFGKGHCRFFIFAAHEIYSSKPKYGISLALMAFVELTKFTESQLRRLQIILSARPSAKRYCSSGLTAGKTSGCLSTFGKSANWCSRRCAATSLPFCSPIRLAGATFSLAEAVAMEHLMQCQLQLPSKHHSKLPLQQTSLKYPYLNRANLHCRRLASTLGVLL